MSSEIKVSSLKAKDGTAGISIADSTGNVSLSGTLSAGTLGSSVAVQAGSPIGVQLTSSASSSNTQYVDFNSSLITDSFKTYRICVNLVIPETDQTQPIIQVSIDNGSNFLSNIMSRRTFQKMSTNSSYGQEQQTQPYIQIGTDLGDDANQGWGGYVDLFGLRNSASHFAFGTAACVGRHYSDEYWWQNGIYIPKGGSTAINFLRLKMSTGQLAAHDVSLWGFK